MRDNNIYQYGGVTEQQLGGNNPYEYQGLPSTLSQNASIYHTELDKGQKPAEEVDLADTVSFIILIFKLQFYK